MSVAFKDTGLIHLSNDVYMTLHSFPVIIVIWRSFEF